LASPSSAADPTATTSPSGAPGGAAVPSVSVAAAVGAWPSAGGGRQRRRLAVALLSMVLLIAAAGLVYELVMAAVASYVLGDSVTQFSTVIGVYLSALGFGAYLSKFVERRLALTFVDVELATAVIGGLSAPALFAAFAFTTTFRFILYATVVVVGVLVGLELPLLIRILRREYEFKELIARALTFDYAGALVGSLAFSLWLVPQLGLVHTSIVCGLLNALVGLASTWLLVGADQCEQRGLGAARVRAVLVTLLLLTGLWQAGRLSSLADATLYGGKVLLAKQSAYQRIVLAERNEATELYLNGSLQFSSADEHRYHEALVHPALAAAARRAKIAIGGGGDGLAAREVLKWSTVQSVTLVDLDPDMTRLGRDHPALVRLNQGALRDPRVTIVNADAMVWFAETDERFDVVLLDFPDPSNYSLGKLYSETFYRTIRRRLLPDGALAAQSTSPLFARAAYWCVVRTLENVGFHVTPYHAFVPSFGEWGYVLATPQPHAQPQQLPAMHLAYLDARALSTIVAFPPDMSRVPTRSNRLDNQALVAYYVAAWRRWN
jgi:spermidine synthase